MNANRARELLEEDTGYQIVLETPSSGPFGCTSSGLSHTFECCQDIDKKFISMQRPLCLTAQTPQW